jgi:hypothetical protein
MAGTANSFVKTSNKLTLHKAPVALLSAASMLLLLGGVALHRPRRRLDRNYTVGLQPGPKFAARRAYSYGGGGSGNVVTWPLVSAGVRQNKIPPHPSVTFSTPT